MEIYEFPQAGCVVPDEIQIMSKKILVVEDDAAVRDGFRLVLERAGYEVADLPNGERILNGHFEMPDLIILDKQLAGVDGLDICRHLKNHVDTKHIPVIMTSAAPHVRHLAEDACAEGFIEKPFNNNDMVALIKKYLP
jgi:CheY-like chemotaxis protein